MSKVIVDIETVGFDFDALDAKTQDYLLKYAGNEEEKREVKEKMGLNPFTGEIVAIGMLNPETSSGVCLFQNNGSGKEDFMDGKIAYESGNEKEILEKFWNFLKGYRQVVTFNGRGFDGPYLMIRSAMHKIKPSKNLMGYRYDTKEHCDLLDQLTFYGANRRFSLDFCAKSFGVKSSKDEGVDGSMVGKLYQEGKYLDIAKYCVRDLFTTKDLHEYWEKYLKF